MTRACASGHWTVSCRVMLLMSRTKPSAARLAFALTDTNGKHMSGNAISTQCHNCTTAYIHTMQCFIRMMPVCECPQPPKSGFRGVLWLFGSSKGTRSSKHVLVSLLLMVFSTKSSKVSDAVDLLLPSTDPQLFTINLTINTKYEYVMA